MTSVNISYTLKTQGYFFNQNAGLRLFGKEVGLIWPKLGQSLTSSSGSLSAETTLPIRVRGCVENSRKLIEVDRKENFITALQWEACSFKTGVFSLTTKSLTQWLVNGNGV